MAIHDFDPLSDGKSKLTLTGFLGNDLTVINAAKASYNRESSMMDDKTIGLMRTLLKGIDEPQHTAPLRHVVFQFKVKCPLSTARQWYKHVIASCHIDEQNGWNETSFRYTKADEQEYYVPHTFRTQNKTNRQASGEPINDDKWVRLAYETHCQNSASLYNEMLSAGVSREQARHVLTPAFYTTFVWTVSLQSLLHFIDLREGCGASFEIAQYAECLRLVVEDKCPIAQSFWNERKQVIKEAMKLYRQLPHALKGY